MTKFVLIVAGIAGLAAQAEAQDPVMALNPTTMIGYAGTVAADQYARREFGARATQRRPAQKRIDGAASVARFSYRPSAAVRQKVYARAIAQAKDTGPAEVAKLRQTLESGALTRDITAYLGRYGMSPTNVADTTALYIAIAWQIAHGTPNDPSRAQMIGLRNQVAATYARMPNFVRANDATKQDLSEANIIQAAYAATIGNAMEKNRSLEPGARAAMVRGVMSLYGLDLRKVSLTPHGLR